MRKYRYIHFLLIFSHNLVQAQNLVPNGDFESPSAGNCASGTILQNGNPTYMSNWFTPNNYYSADAQCSPFVCCGRKSLGIFIRNATYFQEYMEVKLTQPLVAGKTYCAEFYVRTYSGFNNPPNVPVDKIGMFFHAGIITGDSTTGLAPYRTPGALYALDKITPQISNPSGNWISGTACIRVGGTFTAQGGEDYILIGNFTRAVNTPCQDGTNCKSYVIIDNVSVVEGTCSPLATTASVSKSNVCPGECATLTASPTGGNGNYSYSWVPAAGLSSATSQTVQACPSVTTTYTVTVSTKCPNQSASATLRITVGSCSPVPTVQATGGAICSSKCLTIMANGSGGTGSLTYQWSPSAGLNSTTAQSVSACPSVNTTYTVTVTDATNQTNTDTLLVKVNPIPAISAGPNVSICKDSSIALQATGGSGYLWSTGATTGVITVKPSSTSVYTLTGMNSYGCSASSSVTVTVTNCLGAPTVQATGGSVCGSTCINLTANGLGGAGNYVYSWSPATGLNQTSGKTVQACPGVNTTYTVTVADGSGKTGVDTVFVRVKPQPSISAGNDLTICEGSNTTLQATGGVSYLWSNGAATPGISVSPVTTTSYTVIGTDANGCSSDASVKVTLKSTKVNADAGADQKICPGQTAQLNAGGGDAYLWTPIVALSDPTISNPVAAPTESIFYIVTVSSACGNNTASDSVYIKVRESCKLGIPNVITPNNDGKNDVFKIMNLEEFPNTKLLIYNRWGRTIMQDDNYLNDWKAEEVVDGVYYYVLYNKDFENTYTGFIHVLSH